MAKMKYEWLVIDYDNDPEGEGVWFMSHGKALSHFESCGTAHLLKVDSSRTTK